MTYKAEIPYGAYWSTPFTRWQGSLSNHNSIELAAYIAKRELDMRSIDPYSFDYGVLGMTIIQEHALYGVPWLMGMIGAPNVGGPTVNQACATGTRALLTAAQEIESGLASTAFVMTCDRTSNSPHIYYPNSRSIGGTGASEDCVIDNFNCDPLGQHAMIDTAENVAARHKINTQQQHDLLLRRQEQYQDALADNSAFQKRYMTQPFEVPSLNYRKTNSILNGDEGLTPSTAEGLLKLRTVKENGTVTFGGQTHPADGNAAMVVTNAETACELSSNPEIAINLMGFGLARSELAYMPEATIPAAYKALTQAGLGITDMDAIKSHNPFAVNDILFAQETGANLEAMNNFGCTLVWGHPQGPTALRAIIELIEELAVRGGGYGLFEGCAAGDTAMATVIRVSDRQ